MSLISFNLLLPAYSLLTNEFTLYENKAMGIRLNFPAGWKVGLGSNPATCEKSGCVQYIEDMDAQVGLKIAMVGIENSSCNCTSFLEHIRWYYDTLIDDAGFNFINDSETSLAGYPGQVLNYKINHVGSLMDFIIHPLEVTEVIANINGTFYHLAYFGGKGDYNGEGYSDHLQDFDNMKKSVEFFPIQVNKPSFLN